MTVSPFRIGWLAVLTVLAIAVVLSACSDSPAPTPEQTATPTAKSTVEPTATATPPPAPEPTPTPASGPTPTPASGPTQGPAATSTSTAVPTPTPTATPATTPHPRQHHPRHPRHANTNLDTYTHANTIPDTHTHANSSLDTYTRANAIPDTDTHANAIPAIHAHANTNLDTHTYAIINTPSADRQRRQDRHQTRYGVRLRHRVAGQLAPGGGRAVQQRLSSRGHAHNSVSTPPYRIHRRPVLSSVGIRPLAGSVARRFAIRDCKRRGRYEG